MDGAGGPLGLPHQQFGPSHPEYVAVRQRRLLHAGAVHKGAVRAAEILDLERAIRGCCQPAVHARDERRVHDEVRTGRAPKRPAGAGQDAVDAAGLGCGCCL